MRPSLLPTAAVTLLLALAIPPLASAAPSVPWKDQAVFVREEKLSDDFDGDSLDESIWDPHGIRNPDTGCPKWNGPPSSGNPTYSTLFPTSTDPATRQKTVGSYSVSQGTLNLNIVKQPLSFFEAREYYCNATTFKCNHDASIDCFATNFFGNPVYKQGTQEYAFVVHDKCKREPFCVPHPEYVTKQPRVYQNFSGVHLSSKTAFKYGFVEGRVQLGDTPAILALWMHDDTLVDGYCRYRKGNETSEFRRVYECPSAIRSRRWQEIDLLEAMNSKLFKRKYVPNVHCFAAYKGEFTSKEAVDNGAGKMGGGPIVVNDEVFREKTPSFTDVSNPMRNDFHLNPGSVFELPADWAAAFVTVGVYWSPKEIRFYLNGQEVKRLENWLIHQPMKLDISYAWNVEWAKQTPTAEEVGRVGKVDYLRTYKVFTRDGVEPPSSLPLEKTMRNKFNNLYKNKMGGVYGRFPQNDDNTVVAGLPTGSDQVLGANAPTARMAAAAGNASWAVTEPLHRSSKDYVRGFDVPARVRQAAASDKTILFGLPSGSGNRRFPEERKRMSAWARRVAEAQPDRMVPVENGVATEGRVGPTITEITDANCEQSGFSGQNADGQLRCPSSS